MEGLITEIVGMVEREEKRADTFVVEREDSRDM